jgi:6,7-dimethyl-8-ribityllumazine synthase
MLTNPSRLIQTPASQTSSLRIGILYTRWNTPIIQALLEGALSALTSSGVPRSNITVQQVPGSYELPFAAQRMYQASQTTSTSTLVSAATDLLGVGSGSASTSTEDLTKTSGNAATGPFDAIIAIGVLIKGSTMHFEYICDSVSHGLMKVQLDTGCPLIFGVLTCLSEEQAEMRAGMRGKTQGKSHGESGHNHGEDWGLAAIEMGIKRRGWGEGKFL